MMQMHKQKVILLVEDNADDVDLTMYALRKKKIKNELVVMRDGVEALEYLFGPGQADGGDGRGVVEIPGLILLDLKLPRVNGLQVLERLRSDERTRLVPVVVLTSSRETRDVQKTYELGANSYIRKPVDFEEFIESIKNVLHYWLDLNVLHDQEKG